MVEPRKRALITGGTGFVGANLVRRLLRDNWDIHVIVRQGSNLKSLCDYKTDITFHVHDGTTEGLIRLVAGVRPHIVFHLAALFVAEHKVSDVTNLVSSNVLFGAQLLEALSNNGVSYLINTGTSWQHYHSAAYRPVCLYAATKQAFEALLDYYVDHQGIRAITLKLFDTFGPGDTRTKLFYHLRNAAHRNEALAFSEGRQLIDLVFIDDVIDAFTAAAERLLAGSVSGKENYAVSSGRPISLREVVATYSRVTGTDLAIRWGVRPYRNREVMKPWDGGDCLPGWAATTTLEAGIRQMQDEDQEGHRHV